MLSKSRSTTTFLSSASWKRQTGSQKTNERERRANGIKHPDTKELLSYLHKIAVQSRRIMKNYTVAKNNYASYANYQNAMLFEEFDLFSFIDQC